MGAADATIRGAVLAEVASARHFGSSLNDFFDYVMICIPPGTTGSWIAYGKFSMRYVHCLIPFSSLIPIVTNSPSTTTYYSIRQWLYYLSTTISGAGEHSGWRCPAFFRKPIIALMTDSYIIFTLTFLCLLSFSYLSAQVHELGHNLVSHVRSTLFRIAIIHYPVIPS